MTDRLHTPRTHLVRLLAITATLALAAAGCTGGTDTADRTAAPDGQQGAGPEPDNTLTVYSRDRDLAEPLFALFEQHTGITVRARWGNPIDLADQIIADVDSPADVFYAPLSDALGSLRAAGRLAPLTAAQLDRVPAAYHSPDGTWVGISGRAHVVFYNTDQLSADDLPDSILGFTDPIWRDRIGWDPTSRSLQDVVTEVRQLSGDDEARGWLQGIKANSPATIQGAVPIVNAVAAGTMIQVGFGSHSYLYYLQADGDARNVAAKFYRGGELGGLLNVAGVGIIKGTDNKATADAFVDFMLSPAAQRYIAEQTFEIPLAAGVDPPSGKPTADELIVPGLDVRQFEQLADARQLLTEVDIIR